MALSPIMLTAWAVAEIPTLEIDGYRDASTDGVDRVVCRTTDDRVVSISSPLTAPAAELQDAEHRVGQLLGAGVRDRLPFAVPHTLAAGSLDTRRIVVTEEVGGTPLSSVKDPRPVFSSLAAAIAAIHSLPGSIVTRNIVPTTTSLDSLRDAAGVIDRAHQTTKVPSALLDRWDSAIEDSGMWQFTPTITHGGITFDDVLADSGRVTGIINWANCRVADPADDLLNFFGRVSPEVAADFMVAYSTQRPSNDHRLAHRARFASELEIARWLIHGTDTRDDSIVAEAEGMLNSLLASVVDNPATDLGAPPKAPTTLVFGETQAAPPSVPHDPPADEPL
jgi:aminoglycoside phosphotransferase (APT) family kinase protein